MDIRIIRTKKLISEALLELLKEKPIEKITPTELCRNATINRNTFYCHYESIRDVLDDIENGLLKTVDESINGSSSPVDAITNVCQMLKANKKLSAILFHNNSSAKIMKKAFEITNKFNLSKMDREKNTLTDSYKLMLSSYTIMGGAAVLECWVKNNMTEEPRAIAEFIYNISKNGSSFVTK